jgi:predicted nucleic acid-binding protein
MRITLRQGALGHAACALPIRWKRRPPRSTLVPPPWAAITRAAARLAGELKRDYARKGTTLNLGDVIMAAVAIHDELTLLTDNTKDFPMADLSLYPLPKV